MLSLFDCFFPSFMDNDPYWIDLLFSSMIFDEKQLGFLLETVEGFKVGFFRTHTHTTTSNSSRCLAFFFPQIKLVLPNVFSQLLHHSAGVLFSWGEGPAPYSLYLLSLRGPSFGRSPWWQRDWMACRHGLIGSLILWRPNNQWDLLRLCGVFECAFHKK